MHKKKGKQTIIFDSPVSILSTASIAGKKEREGPLGEYFDYVYDDSYAGEETWEKAESKMIKHSLELAIKKANIKKEEIDYVVTGDLLNQGIGSTFGIRDLEIPFLGIYGACSSMGEAMLLGSTLVDGGFAEYVLAGASSHFAAAEKQFRFPLGLGVQRPQTSTWTVTGGGTVVLAKEGKAPYITAATVGKIVDLGVADAANLGAAMAPAAADTIYTHFKDTGRKTDYYDLIITGDLGHIGKELMLNLLLKKDMNISSNYSDCGIEIFDKETQDTHSGGSGCACSAITFSGYLYEQMRKDKLNKILFVPTGALFSPLSTEQGEDIPGIAHALAIENHVD